MTKDEKIEWMRFLANNTPRLALQFEREKTEAFRNRIYEFLKSRIKK